MTHMHTHTEENLIKLSNIEMFMVLPKGLRFVTFLLKYYLSIRSRTLNMKIAVEN